MAKIKVVLDMDLSLILDGSKDDFLKEVNRLAEDKFLKLNRKYSKLVDMSFSCKDEASNNPRGRCENQCWYCNEIGD